MGVEPALSAPPRFSQAAKPTTSRMLGLGGTLGAFPGRPQSGQALINARLVTKPQAPGRPGNRPPSLNRNIPPSLQPAGAPCTLWDLILLTAAGGPWVREGRRKEGRPGAGWVLGREGRQAEDAAGAGSKEGLGAVGSWGLEEAGAPRKPAGGLSGRSTGSQLGLSAFPSKEGTCFLS